MNKIFIYILLISTAFACQEEYEDPNLNQPINGIAIEGIITNLPGPYRIDITRPVPYNHSDYTHQSFINCSVTLFGSDGSVELLKEKQPGAYYTSDDGIQGKTGEKYYIRVVTPALDTIYSDTCKIVETKVSIKTSCEFGSKSFLTERNDGEIQEITQTGVNMYLYATPLSTEPYYYSIESIVIDQKLHYFYPETKYIIMPPSFPVYSWKKYKLSNELILKANATNKYQEIKKYNIGFIPQYNYFSVKGDSFNDPPITKGYIVTTHVFSLPESVYGILTKIAQQVNPENSIFDPIPVSIVTNLHCVNNKELKVYGYFGAAQVTYQTHFVYWSFNSTKLYEKDVDFPLKPVVPPDGSIQSEEPFFWINKD